MLPKIIYAGAKLEWSEQLSDYPATDGYTLNYVLINSTEKHKISSTLKDEKFYFNPDTSSYSSGEYRYQKYVSKTGENDVMIEVDKVTVKPFFDSAITYQTEEEEILANLKTSYKKMSEFGHTNIKFPDGREVEYNRTQLLREINRYEWRVKTQKKQSGNILGRFTR